MLVLTFNSSIDFRKFNCNSYDKMHIWNTKFPISNHFQVFFKYFLVETLLKKQYTILTMDVLKYEMALSEKSKILKLSSGEKPCL